MTTSSKLGYTAAGTTILAAVLAPFLLFPVFTKGFAHMGLHIDEVYSGGPKLRTIQAGAYAIDIHRQVTPHFWQTEKPFVQIDWRPATVLPSHVSEAVDIDGDGQPDVQVNFDVPTDRKTKLFVNVDAMNPRYESMRNVGKQKFSSMIARVDDAIVVRIPVK
ncbi:MAG TPA: hypothetical protein VGS27_26185 [Candidatus Sulfotelmatobacter sp.]|nr:hypothetical protein [Candidatus Sulfotelmatobacter sp.]